jgi:hypothetical protein
MMAGAAVLAVGALVYAFVLEALRRKDKAYPSTAPADSTWWFGYARDLGNLAGCAAFVAGFWLLGFPPPEAVVAGVGLTLVCYGLDYLVGRGLRIRRPMAALVPLLLGLVAGVMLARAAILEGLQSLRTLLF